MLQRVMQDWDVVAIVTGEEGVGKSKLILGMMAYHILPKLGLPFKAEDYVFLSGEKEDLSTKWVENERYTPILIDEAIDMFFNMDFQTKVSKTLKKEATSARYLNKIVFLNIPNISDLNKSFRDRRCQIWIHIPRRGLGLMFVRSKNFFARDPWCLEYGEKLLRNCKNMKTLVYKASKIPSFVCWFRIKDWESQVWKDYLKVKDDAHKEKREKEAQLEEEKASKGKAVVKEDTFKGIIEKLHFERNMTYSQIATLFGVSYYTVRGWAQKFMMNESKPEDSLEKKLKKEGLK